MLNDRKKWTSYGTSKLIYLAIRGASNIEIARELARTPKAVERKKHRMKHDLARKLTFADMMEAMFIGSHVLAGNLKVVGATE